MRQSKVGIDIRLRRKINGEHDEVTDIQLVPGSKSSGHEFRDEKYPWIPELPNTSKEINELPDNSTPVELEAIRQATATSELETVEPSPRTSTGSSIGEPLPRYEPRRDATEHAESTGSGQERTPSPETLHDSAHRPSASQSSIVATPTRRLFSMVFDNCDEFGSDPNSEDNDERFTVHAEAKPHVNKDPSEQLSATSIDETIRMLEEERPVSDSLQSIIYALLDKQSKEQNQNVEPQEDKN